MRIFYFSGATLPSESAQSVHVMKMCHAMTAALKKNAVTLFAKGDINANDDDIFRYYGVPPIFSLVLTQNPKIPLLTGILRLLGHDLILRETGVPDLAYGRDPVELDYLIPENVPVVLELHQVPRSFFQVRSVKGLIRRKRFIGLIVISERLKEDILKKFSKLKKDTIFVAHDGADISEKEITAKEIPGRSDVLKVGYTGSLHEGKGMETIAVLAKNNSGYDFHVVGGSKAQVKDWQSRNLPANVFMHGHVPHAELAPYLAAFDILIAPYSDRAKIKTGADISRWMSPLKIFEYMGAKKPILSSDLPVIREVLKDGENALLVAPSDLKGWNAALANLQDKVLRERLAEKAYTDLKDRYSWAIRAGNILKFVDKRI